MGKTIRWGIIGCGNVTERKSGPAFQKAVGSSLVAVMRRNGDLARDYANRHGVPRWYDDAESLITDPEVDAVYVATPPKWHKPYALACARAGKPAYIEKPMALDTCECEQMIDAFGSAGLPLFVAYYRRALPRFVGVKHLIESGELGHPRFVQIQMSRAAADHERDTKGLPWRVQPSVSAGGHFVDLGCHTLDFLGYVLGDVVEAHGTASNLAGLYPAEDTVTASFRFGCGALGCGVWCFCAAERHDLTTIVGDAGSVSFSTFADVPICVTTAGGVRREIDIPNPDPIQLPLVQTIVDALRGNGQCPSTGATALRTTWAIDRVLRDYRARGI